MHNFTYWTENFMNMSMQGYTTSLGFLTWPLIFSAIVGYVYLKTQSVVAFAVAVLLIFVTFSANFVSGVGVWYSFMHIIVAMIFTVLILIFVSKVRR